MWRYYINKPRITSFYTFAHLKRRLNIEIKNKIFISNDESSCVFFDILFESLTPEEHLRLYASFKETESILIEDQV
jgi:hypothetical protein